MVTVALSFGSGQTKTASIKCVEWAEECRWTLPWLCRQPSPPLQMPSHRSITSTQLSLLLNRKRESDLDTLRKIASSSSKLCPVQKTTWLTPAYKYLQERLFLKDWDMGNSGASQIAGGEKHFGDDCIKGKGWAEIHKIWGHVLLISYWLKLLQTGTKKFAKEL